MKFLITLLLLLSIIFSVIGYKAIASTEKEDSRKINYMRDMRTGLCFAYFNSSNKLGLANVPCDFLKNVYVRKFYIKNSTQ